ncbi:GNAT family N-acetyltransferase [Streptomyces microflavus]
MHDVRAHRHRRPSLDTPGAFRDCRALQPPGGPPAHAGPARRATRLYGFADDPDATPAADFDPPVGLFLIAHVGDKPVGGGGVRLLDEHTAEIKRMYVSGVARVQGIGRYLLEQHAASRRARRIMRETGRRNTAALALYNRAGSLPCPSYVAGRDPRANRAMAKALGSSSAR